MSDELRNHDGREPAGAEPKPDGHYSELPQETAEPVDSSQQSDAALEKDSSPERERELSVKHNSDDASQAVNLQSIGAAANGQERPDPPAEEHEPAQALSEHAVVPDPTKIDELRGDMTSPQGESLQSPQTDIDDPFSGELTL